MAWTNLTFAYNSLLTSTKMTQLDDNFDALAAGASGAPEIVDAALATPGALKFIASVDFSSDATSDWTAFDATKYDAYMFVLANVVPASNGTSLYMRTSTNGGSSYDSGASDYSHSASAYHSSPGADDWGDNSDSEIMLADAVLNAGTYDGVSGQVLLVGAHLAQATQINALVAFKTTTGYLSSAAVAGYRNSAADVDAVRFLFSTGNISTGTITMYGLTNSATGV